MKTDCMSKIKGRISAACIALILFILSADINAAGTDIRLNSIGFLPVSVKRASISMPCSAFTVNKASDSSVVFSGTVTGPVASVDTGENIYTADFSAVTQPDSYYLDVPGVGQSAVFPVVIDAYNNAFYMALKAMYLWRCGTAVSYTYPRDANTYSHAACHMQDGWLDFVGGGHTQKDATQGWHDAGDYNKYTYPDGYTTGLLLDAWFMYKDNITPMPLDIPDTAPGYPDFLKEIKWETDWLLKMIAPDNAGYNKISEQNFCVFIMPEANTIDRFFVPAGTQDTAVIAAVLSMASRAFASYDPLYAAQCLNAAAASYAYLTSTPADVMSDLTGFTTGALFGDIPAARMWAAAEVWEATGSAAALADFESRAASFAPDYVDKDFDWQNVKNMAMYTYVLSVKSGKNPALLANVENNIVAAADAIVITANSHAYGRPLGEIYYWGCNGSVARQTMLLQMANRISPRQDYIDTALGIIGYLFGRNMHNRSYVTGVGLNPPMYPHHRPSGADAITNPWPGYLVGGSPGTNAPGPTGNDWVVGAMPSGLPPAQYWVDVQDAYSANEVALNWQGSLIFALAGFVHPQTPTLTPTQTATITGTPPSQTPTHTVTQTMPPPSVNAICLDGASITVDGNLSDAAWQSGTWTGVTRVTEGTAGAVSARYMLRWDLTALYAGLDITDPSLCYSNTNWFEDDDVEIYIDADNNHSATYAVDDFEFSKRYNDPVTREASGNLGSVTAATYQTVTGYSVEFRIPWSDLGKTPSAGFVMGFDAGVNHNEACGTTRDGVFMWSGNANNWQNTSAFGEAYLSACANTPTYTITAASTATVTPTATPPGFTVFVPAGDVNIQYSGRIDFTNPNAPRFDWPGVSILAVFQGSGIGILLTDGNNDYNVFIDGALNTVIATTSATQYNITGLTNSTHTLLVTKRNEAYFGIGTFNGLMLETGAGLMTPPAKPARRVEFCGDSYTCAYGVESPQLSCNSAQLRQYGNNWLDYAAIAARAACAEYHITAYSGRGIVHNYGDTSQLSADPLPYYYPRTLANSASPVFNYSSWIPDAVVIFLGTNDFSAGNVPTQSQYETGYRNFIATIRGAYAFAKIICVSFSSNNTMKTYVQNVVTQENTAGDTNVVYAELSDIGAQFTGCDYHPGVSGQQQMAADMEAILQNQMGWSGCPANTPTQTATSISTPSITPSATATAELTTVTPTCTPTRQAQSDKLSIPDMRTYPNPFNPSRQENMAVVFNITKNCDTVKLSLYTSGFRLIRQKTYTGGFYAGDNEVRMDSEELQNLSSGIYYYVITAAGPGNTDRASRTGEVIMVRDRQ